MSGKRRHLTLTEWESASPETHPQLMGTFLESAEQSDLARHWTQTGRLLVEERRNGLIVRAASWVGSVRLGELTITIQPKIAGDSLLHLLGYALERRAFTLYDSAMLTAGQPLFPDLLLWLLLAEARELLTEGLYRRAVREERSLTMPRGRLDFVSLSRHPVLASPELPCICFSPTEDLPVHQVLLSGLIMAQQQTLSPSLRHGLRQLAEQLRESVRLLPFSLSALREVVRQLNRQTARYLPALRLIELLAEGMGGDAEGSNGRAELPGYLFDMNRFYQALVARFLRENLPGYEVREDQKLEQVVAYHPAYNPQSRPGPTLRPDFLVLQKGRAVAVLDAKYRDLWEHPLPPEMLYQLTIYAVTGGTGEAVILYPTTNPAATEQRLRVSAPVNPREKFQVVLRPLLLARLENLVTDGSLSACQEYARQLVFAMSAPMPSKKKKGEELLSRLPVDLREKLLKSNL